MMKKEKCSNMYSTLKSLKSLSFSRKLQLIRIFIVFQAIVFSLLLYFVQPFVEVFLFRNLCWYVLDASF